MTGAVAEQAKRLLHALHASTCRLPRAWDADYRDAESAAIRSNSLGWGCPGFWLFLHYAQVAHLAPDTSKLVRGSIAKALAVYESTPSAPSLFAGFTGVGWALAHLGIEAGFPYEQANQALRLSLESPSLDNGCDLVGGALGGGVFGLEQERSDSARLLVEAVVACLARTSSKTSDGITWFRQGSERSLRRYALCGVAHGTAGAAAFLSQCLRRGIAADVSSTLLEGAVAWLLRQMDLTRVGTCFPLYVDEEGKADFAARPAWCHGDAGIAAVLVDVGHAHGVDSWLNAGLQAARHMAAWRPADARCRIGGGLCHGSASLAHICNRLYQSTGDEVLAAAASFWIRSLLDDAALLGPEVAGCFLDQQGRARHDPGFLMGAAGVGMVLLAALGQRSDWDRSLLISAK